MSWYPDPTNATTGLFGILNATSAGMNAQLPGLGGNIIGISILLPVWVIVFLPVSRVSFVAAMTASCFICSLLSLYLMTLNLVSEWAFLLFMILSIFFASAFYMQTRQ